MGAGVCGGAAEPVGGGAPGAAPAGGLRDAACAEKRVEGQQKVRIGGLHLVQVACS